MAMSLDEFSARVEVVFKDQLEAAARLRDDFNRKLEALLVEAKGEHPDLSAAQMAVFKAHWARFEKMAEKM